LSDTHGARLTEERQAVQDRGDASDGTTRIRSEAIAPRNAKHAAVILYVSHRQRTHGQKDQHDAGGNRSDLPKHSATSGSHWPISRDLMQLGIPRENES
jgi:hypothetical protein